MRVQRRNIIENGVPTRRRSAVTKNSRHDLVLHHVARDQGSVWFDKRQFIALGMSASEPEESRRDTAQVELRLLLKDDVGCAECGVGQQVLVLRRATGKQVYHFLAV